MKIGIDIGGVIINKKPFAHDKDTAFDEDGTGTHYLDTPAVESAFDVIRKICLIFGWENTWIISKCYEGTQKKTRKWLRHNKFFEKTGFHPDHVIYCYERSSKVHLAKGLGLTHFIDDRREVLDFMRGVVPNLFLFGLQEELAPEWCLWTPTWEYVKVALKLP